MKVYKGKNALWLKVVFIIYNLLPLVLVLYSQEIVDCTWKILIWIIYYGFNIIWLPIMIRNYIEVYDDYFIFYYGFTKEYIYMRDIIKCEKSRNSIASCANSLDRIHIITNKKEFYVSLKNNDKFMEDIRKNL